MAESKRNRQFIAQETRFQGKYSASVRNTLFQAYRPVMTAGIAFMVLGFVGRLALLGNANFIGYWVDSLCLNLGAESCRPLPPPLRMLNSQQFAQLLMLATAVGFALTLLFRVGVSRLSAHAVSRIYDETTYRTSRLPMSFYDQNPAGRIMTRFSSDYNNIFRIFGGPLAEFIGLIFDLIAMTALITLASPWFLPFWGLQGVLNFSIYKYFLPSLRRERREVALKRSPGIAHFAETVNGASTIRSFGRQSVFERRFARLNDMFLAQRLVAAGVMARFSLSMGAATALMFLVTGLSSVYLVKTHRVGIGSVGVAFAYIGLSANILQSFFEWLGQFEDAMTGLERMEEYLRFNLEEGAKLPREAKFDTGHPREGETQSGELPVRIGDGHVLGAAIEITNLKMRYREDLPLVLRGVNLSVRAGERLAVVGRTGSGKTSLVQALFRLYPIEEGTIRVAGFEARVSEVGVDLSAYRSLMAYITQEATLFLGTLRDNLSVNGNVKEADLLQALRRVHFLSPQATDKEYLHWLEYRIEEKGRNLSVGERQLVCMARCLLQDAPVVILDEATSSVDPRSEEIITRATEEFFVGKTQIIIAHRLSTIRACDRVIWLQEGQIHRQGAPSEVLPEFERAALGV